MKERLDKIMTERGLVVSRERAKALIMEGKVLVDNKPATKAGSMVGEDAGITLKGEDIPFVSRGGIKLDAAIKHFGAALNGLTVMDVGVSTGGFTDCMLKRGAKKIYAIDVGYGQIDWNLRNDPRVVLMEKTNIRHLEKSAVPDEIDLATIDVSFISLKLVLPKVKEFLKPGGLIIALIKPQFEVGRKDVGKGGIVKDEGKRVQAVEDIKDAAMRFGLMALDVMKSPIKGQKGNVEYFIYLKGK